jgi:adenylyltransferase/sulfurtransferase
VLKDIGYEGQLKLKKTKVCVIGLGGLGGTASIQLARLGVGFLRLVDRDVVERSNLHRQFLYNFKDIGRRKAEVAAERINLINPNVEVDSRHCSVDVGVVNNLVKDVNVVIDGLDRIETRYVINRACVWAGIPYVFGSATETYGNASTIIPSKTPCLECFYPHLKDEMLPAPAEVGVHPSLPSIIASIQVSEALRIIKGEKPCLADLLLYFDLRNMSFDKIAVLRQKNCPVCGWRKP